MYKRQELAHVADAEGRQNAEAGKQHGQHLAQLLAALLCAQTVGEVVHGLSLIHISYTKYVKDQVFGRDQWISLQSMVETTLLQKEQNGGILLGKEHKMCIRDRSMNWLKNAISSGQLSST